MGLVGGGLVSGDLVGRSAVASSGSIIVVIIFSIFRGIIVLINPLAVLSIDFASVGLVVVVLGSDGIVRFSISGCLSITFSTLGPSIVALLSCGSTIDS